MNRTLTKHLTTLWPALLCLGGVASGDESSRQGAAIFPSGHAAQTAEGAGELPEWWNAPAERDRHISAQLGAPTYGWTLAYDGENRPAWSRVYHPPAVSSGSSHSAASMLFFMYDLTGDPKYLDPVRKYIEAEKRMATKIRVDGREIQVRGNLVDYQSGRPIAVDVKTWKTYFLDTPEERAAFLRTGATQWKVTGTYSEDKFPWYPSFFRKPEWPDLQVALENRRGGKRPRPEQLSNAVLAESLSSMIKEAEKIIAEQNDKGTWPILSTQVGA